MEGDAPFPYLNTLPFSVGVLVGKSRKNQKMGISFPQPAHIIFFFLNLN
jgi:hypothetical protein